MKQKKVWVGLLCIFLLVVLAGNLIAQEEKQERQRRPRFSWKGPDLGTEIQDFELPILGGENFKLSEHKGEIIVIELGACT